MLLDGQHRVVAVVEAESPVVTVFTDVEPGTFDVLDNSKKRNAAIMRTVWQ